MRYGDISAPVAPAVTEKEKELLYATISLYLSAFINIIVRTDGTNVSKKKRIYRLKIADNCSCGHISSFQVNSQLQINMMKKMLRGSVLT